MSHALMTVADLKQALPKALQHQASQEFADKVNMIVAEPEAAEEVRNNFLTYAKVLQEGKYKTEDYLNAVTYATFKIMGYTNKDAYAKTFRDRYNTLVLRGCSDKDISSYVAAYHKNKLVNTILEQAVIPTWLLNQDVFQKAINQQLHLMQNAQSEKVQTDAANSLLTHLKPPETKKVELDISVKNQGGISDLMATMEQLAQTQLDMIRGGANAREIGRTPLMIEGEVQEIRALQHIGPPAVAVPLPHVGPPAQAVPLNTHVPSTQVGEATMTVLATCTHGVPLRYQCEVCSPPAVLEEKTWPTELPPLEKGRSLFAEQYLQQPTAAAVVPANPFAQLEDLRTGGDFEYREDVVVLRQKTVALTLFPE